jgi:hypothetical protein
MLRRKARFSAAGHYAQAAEEEAADPRTGLVNLADVMLVLAVALMCALIDLWGVDVSALAQVSADKMQPVEAELTSGEATESLSGDQFEEIGTVYRDKTTGETYLLED